MFDILLSEDFPQITSFEEIISNSLINNSYYSVCTSLDHLLLSQPFQLMKISAPPVRKWPEELPRYTGVLL